jgi:hypothetical protein
MMDYQHDKSSIFLNKNVNRAKRERSGKDLEIVVALKDVPLEVRRKEAKKPLYLTRYE